MRRSARAALLVPFVHRTRRRQRPGRRAGLLLAAAVTGALTLSGCQTQSPVTTSIAYDPADGVSTTVGDVSLADLLVVTSAKGSPGIVSGRAVNTGDKDVTLHLSAPNSSPVTATVPAHGQVELSGRDAPAVDLSTVNVAPGAMLALSISSPSHGSSELQVPVLLPRGPYATMTPSAVATSSG